MNKWMKQSMTGLLLATAAVGILSEAKEQAPAREISVNAVDAVELAGGSKLKDRMIETATLQNLKLVRALPKV